MEGVGGGKTRVDKGEWKNNIREGRNYLRISIKTKL